MGWIPARKKEKSDKEKNFDQIWRNHNDYLATKQYCERNYQGLGLGEDGTREYLSEVGLSRHEDGLLPNQDGDRELVTTVDLTGWEQQTEKFDPRREVVRRSPKGTNGITSYGTKMVRSGCHALQKNYGRKQLGLNTVTLPNHPVYTPLWVSRWSEIVRKYEQEIRRELERKGAPSHFIGVTEIQTERSDNIGYCVPHLHAVYVAWDGITYRKVTVKGHKKRLPAHYISHSKFQQIFRRILINEIIYLTGEQPDKHGLMPRVEVKGVKKSAEGYLGKYMSKGAKDVKKYLDADPNRTDIPSHWWHCSKELRNIIKGLVTNVAPTMVELITSNFGELIEAGLVQYIRPIQLEINGVLRTLGYAGRWKPAYNPTTQEDIESAFSTS